MSLSQSPKPPGPASANPTACVLLLGSPSPMREERSCRESASAFSSAPPPAEQKMPFQSPIASHLFWRVYGPRDVGRLLLRHLAGQAIGRIGCGDVDRHQGRHYRLCLSWLCIARCKMISTGPMYLQDSTVGVSLYAYLKVSTSFNCLTYPSVISNFLSLAMLASKRCTASSLVSDWVIMRNLLSISRCSWWNCSAFS
jgi:hypothetical protein